MRGRRAMCRSIFLLGSDIVAQSVLHQCRIFESEEASITYRFPFIVMVPTMQTIGTLPGDGLLSGEQCRLCFLRTVDVGVRRWNVKRFTDTLCEWLPTVIRGVFLIRPLAQKGVRVEFLHSHADSVCVLH